MKEALELLAFGALAIPVGIIAYASFTEMRIKNYIIGQIRSRRRAVYLDDKAVSTEN